jgi:methylmalonyl-CoA mutase cobalamin-binding domain/chain
MTEKVKEIVAAGKLKLVEATVQEAIDAGATPQEVLDAMMEAMDIVGTKFQNNEIYVPEMLVAAKTMQRGVGVLKPLLGGDSSAKYGTYVLGTVAGDLHDIGKNLVGLMIESAGFDVIDLGVDVPAEKFVEAVKSHPDCKVVGVSALLTTTMESMRVTVKALLDAGLHDQVKIMVGGAPINEEFAKEIGADAYTPDAGAAAAKARELASC